MRREYDDYDERDFRYRGSGCLGSLLKGLIILVALILAFRFFFYDALKEKVNGAVADIVWDKAQDYAASVLGEEKVDRVLSQIAKEDEEKIKGIIADHVSVGNALELQSLIESGSSMDLMKYAQNELSDEEQKELIGLYQKYSDVLK